MAQWVAKCDYISFLWPCVAHSFLLLFEPHPILAWKVVDIDHNRIFIQMFTHLVQTAATTMIIDRTETDEKQNPEARRRAGGEIGSTRQKSIYIGIQGIGLGSYRIRQLSHFDSNE
jgi:hypothetical protein